jgi:hypothetical protein
MFDLLILLPLQEPGEAAMGALPTGQGGYEGEACYSVEVPGTT